MRPQPFRNQEGRHEHPFVTHDNQGGEKVATEKKTRTMSKVTLRKGYLAVIKDKGLTPASMTLAEFDEILKDEIVAEQMEK